MRHVDAEIARLHARSDRYRRKLDVAMEIAREGMEQAGSAFVSFSCGKDSAATLSIAQEVSPGIEGRMIRSPESRWIDDFDRVLSDYEARGTTIRVLDLARASLDERVPERWRLLREMKPVAGQFSGLRADESKARRKTIAVRGPVYRVKGERCVRICPIAWWTTLDVPSSVLAPAQVSNLGRGSRLPKLGGGPIGDSADAEYDECKEACVATVPYPADVVAKASASV